ncbi:MULTISPECIES: hypothetical protein [Enterobacter]|uniref:hypothetical protein n=1 Tax=Enterobacter TaxID=547 RepID=UPI0011132635|nr:MULTISPECIES: hypothetical protein [Enterobacter cloacae complex]MEC5763537.1 hypothetical protein [Enterobacter chengduensis]NBC78780.1 hypothetical protein [Enterobacter asburiae]HBM9902864.1 hypothetical protein [Enterobacter chengduensis]
MKDQEIHQFTSISEIVKKRGRKAGRLPFSNNLNISQICRSTNNQHIRYMTINIPEDVMSKARFKKGDRVDIAFTDNGVFWRLKVVPNGEQGYSITTPSNNSKRGQLRLTWCEGIPLLGNDIKIKKARAIAVEKTMRVSPAEIIFELGEVIIEDKAEA